GPRAGADRRLFRLQPGRRGDALAPLSHRPLRRGRDVEPRLHPDRPRHDDGGLVELVRARVPGRGTDAGGAGGRRVSDAPEDAEAPAPRYRIGAVAHETGIEPET